MGFSFVSPQKKNFVLPHRFIVGLKLTIFRVGRELDVLADHAKMRQSDHKSDELVEDSTKLM